MCSLLTFMRPRWPFWSSEQLCLFDGSLRGGADFSLDPMAGRCNSLQQLTQGCSAIGSQRAVEQIPLQDGKRNVLMKKYVVTTKHQLIWKWLCSISTKTSQCLAKMSMLGYIQCTGNVRKKYGFSYGKNRPFSAYFRLLYGVRVCTGYCTYLVRTEYVICQYHNFSMVL